MTINFPPSGTPAWYIQADWKSAGKNRNGVFYEGDTVKFWPGQQNPPPAVAGPHSQTFELGTNGATIQTSDQGDASTRWNVVSNSPIYDNAHAWDGSLSAKFNADNQVLQWTYGDNPGDYYGRMYVWLDSLPATNKTRILVSQCQGGGSHDTSVWLLSSGKLNLIDTANTHSVTSTAAVATGQWIRIEWHRNYGTGGSINTDGVFEVRFFNDPNSSTPTESVLINPATVDSTPPLDERFGFSTGHDGVTMWVDNITSGYTGGWIGTGASPPPSTETIAYEIRNFYGDIVSTGGFSSIAEEVDLQVPDGGWKNGWYRIYMTGSNTDATFGNSYGASNFCIIRDDSHFVTMPDAATSGGASITANDYVTKGVLGNGTSRISVSDVTDLNASQVSTSLASDAELTGTYWVTPGSPYADSSRPRYSWTDFPNGAVDFLSVPDTNPAPNQGTWLRVYCKDGTLDGSQVFVKTSAGTNANTDKVQVYFPDSSTLVETYDNLSNVASAVAAINGVSSYIEVFQAGHDRATYTGPSAIGNAHRAGLVSAVSTLYSAGITRFEGPSNEPPGNSETAHKMMIFQHGVHAGNASAVAIGPCTVDLPNLIGFLNAGGGAYCDELSTHAYNAPPNTSPDINLTRTQFDAAQAAIVANGLTGTRWWQTESTQAMTAVYAVHHPRRSVHQVFQMLFMEQYGIAKEFNNPWYDFSHGFWSFPTWTANSDGSLQPQAPMIRVLSEEVWGRPYASALDFGTPGNNIFFGNVYTGSDGTSVVALMSTSYMDDCTITLQLTSAPSTVTVVDGFGNESTGDSSDGTITVSLTDIPTYIRLPNGTSASVSRVNSWDVSSSQVTPSSASVASTSTTRPIDGRFCELYGFNNDLQEFNSYLYYDFTGLPRNITLNLSSATRVNRVVIWAGFPWQNTTTFTDFDIQTTTDGSNWVTAKTVTKPMSYFPFVTDQTNTGCSYETYWPGQWVFDEEIGDVEVTGIRLVINESSFGGEPFAVSGIGQGRGDDQALTIAEVQLFNSDGTPVVAWTVGRDMAIS